MLNWKTCQTCKKGYYQSTSKNSIFSKSSTECSDCIYSAKEDGEITHGNAVRCPKCRHISKIDGDDGYIYEEGSHEMCCYECDHEFTIETNVTYSFVSPPILEDKDA